MRSRPTTAPRCSSATCAAVAAARPAPTQNSTVPRHVLTVASTFTSRSPPSPTNHPDRAYTGRRVVAPGCHRRRGRADRLCGGPRPVAPGRVGARARRQLPGSGASQASAGMLCPHIEGSHDPLLQQLGADSLALRRLHPARPHVTPAWTCPTSATARSRSPTPTRARGARLTLPRPPRPGRALPAGRRRSAPSATSNRAPPHRAGLLIEAHGAVRIRDLVDALRQASLHLGVRYTRRARRACDARRPPRRRHACADPARRHVVVTAGAWSMTCPSPTPADSDPSRARTAAATADGQRCAAARALGARHLPGAVGRRGARRRDRPSMSASTRAPPSLA